MRRFRHGVVESLNLDPRLQLDLRNRPEGRALMLHKWRDLVFLHYSIEPEAIQSLLPDGLTVDTFDGKAWVGLVPFWMTGIRAPWLPPIPGTHTFAETNVRTYVHREGKVPGVWFFSLDAANSLAVWGARRFFGLPYFRAEMHVERGAELRYRSVRRQGEATHDIRIRPGVAMAPPEPGSLEFYLVERYLLYSVKAGELVTGLVHHKPYPVQQAEIVECRETMLRGDGVPERPWEHVCYSPGVDVEVFAIRNA